MFLTSRRKDRTGAQMPPETAKKPPAAQRAHIIVFGNEKGGSGKSTSAMHVAVALLRLGYRVGTLDLDARQASFTRYMKNRFDHILRERLDTPMPTHMAVHRSTAETIETRNDEDRKFLHMALAEQVTENDFLVIDTPGSDTFLSRLAHSYADTLITPLNDSFVDLDVIGRVDPQNHEISGPSIYTRTVHEQRGRKIARGDGPIDWIVMRNRLSHIDSRSRREIGEILEKMAEKFSFRTAPGFGERVIFRELFLKGLTLLDLKDEGSGLTLSQVSARQEVRQLIAALAPEKLKGHRNPKVAASI